MGKKFYGDFENVTLSDTEYAKLQEKFGTKTEEKINDLSYYLEKKGVKYKSHYATILSWHRSDLKKEKEMCVKKTGFNNFENNETSDYEDMRRKNLERLMSL